LTGSFLHCIVETWILLKTHQKLYRCERLAVFEEDRIVPNAQADEDIEIGFFPVQDSCLNNGAAHGLKLPDSYLFLLLDPYVFLGCGAGLADNRDDIEALSFQDFCERPCLLIEARAKGDA